MTYKKRWTRKGKREGPRKRKRDGGRKIEGGGKGAEKKGIRMRSKMRSRLFKKPFPASYSSSRW